MVGENDGPDPNVDEFKTPIVQFDDGTLGIVLSYGAYVSRVEYIAGGIHYEVIVPNEDFFVLSNVNFRYEDDT
jgi:hypothetical protein